MKIQNFSLKKTLSLLISMFFVFNSASAIAKTEIHWWHAMGGANGERVDRIAAGFNDSQNDYVVVPAYKFASLSLRFTKPCSTTPPPLFHRLNSYKISLKGACSFIFLSKVLSLKLPVPKLKTKLVKASN